MSQLAKYQSVIVFKLICGFIILYIFPSINNKLRYIFMYYIHTIGMSHLHPYDPIVYKDGTDRGIHVCVQIPQVHLHPYVAMVHKDGGIHLCVQVPQLVPFASLCPNGTQGQDCVCIGTIGTSHLNPYVPMVHKTEVFMCVYRYHRYVPLCPKSRQVCKVFMCVCVCGGGGVYDTIANSLCVCANGIYHYVPSLRIPMSFWTLGGNFRHLSVYLKMNWMLIWGG